MAFINELSTEVSGSEDEAKVDQPAGSSTEGEGPSA
jgi:hypothetical protein